jgi:hypothetical protein
MNETEREKLRQLLIRAASHCPSSTHCIQGDREILAGNSQLTLEAICDALQLLTGSRGNFERVEYRVKVSFGE